MSGPGGVSFHAESFPQGQRQVIRITAAQPGTWTYVVHGPSGVVEKGRLHAQKSEHNGFVRPRNHAFTHADGSAFVAIGENRINIYDRMWNWKALSIEDYLAHMARHGMSVIRVFIVTDIENEEKGGPNDGVLEPALGEFDEEVAQQFDRIFRAAQAHDISVVLVAFALGLSEDDDWKSWRDNPYSAERGGPAASRYDFFEEPAVRARAAERIRYIAKRYGPFPNLLAIDLLNEPEWDGAIPEVSWGPWAEVMAQEWDRADPYEHAVTVGSVGLHWNIEGDERAWWSSEACDIVQWHLYGKEVYDVHALAAEMSRKVRETWAFGKPVLVGEFAYGGEPKPDYDHTHVGLWSAAFSGAGVLAHSAPTFNVDSDEVMTPERALHFRVLREVLDRLPFATPAVPQTKGGSRAWALLGDQRAAAWILASKARYGSSVENNRISLRVKTGGLWRVRWRDDVTGATLAESESRTTSDGTLDLRVPPFSRHAVAELSWRQPAP